MIGETRYTMKAANRGITLFDPSNTAHSANALRGMATAAVDARIPVWVYGPGPGPADLIARGVKWVEATGKADLMTRSLRRDHRQMLIDALASTEPACDSVFCDLGLDRTITSRGRRIAASAATVFVSHGSLALDHPVRNTRERLRRGRDRNELRRLGVCGSNFVVHTEAVARRLADFVPVARVHQLGWPVVSAADPCLGVEGWPAAQRRTILFAGSARNGKGLLPFVQAAEAVASFDRLVVPGRIPPKLRDRMRATDPRFESLDRWMDEAEYRQTFTEAALVALPYTETYAQYGMQSSVLLEAMAHGRPVLVSQYLAHLLPPGYEGAIVADVSTKAGIVEGLRRALDTLDGLERAALTVGRRFVAEHHTYERYVSGLLKAGEK